ncbi:hypothetical protein ACFYZ2_16240 [Streptomyces sviceus]|uniref:hypothetical protein n=1 Tax=Streptomyces sviceus TaxID=285530 RepID=UPI0036AABB85
MTATATLDEVPDDLCVTTDPHAGADHAVWPGDSMFSAAFGAQIPLGSEEERSYYIMSWRVAAGLETLLHQIDVRFPERSKLSDGGIGVTPRDFTTSRPPTSSPGAPESTSGLSPASTPRSWPCCPADTGEGAVPDMG